MFKRFLSQIYKGRIPAVRLMHSHSKTSYNQKYSLVSPILFDVSLRDGIQGADPKLYTTPKKLSILENIHEHFVPHKIEIGSFVSPKVLPIMSDTAVLFDQMPEYIKNVADIYVLVPNRVGLLKAIDCGLTNFSFITSVSNAFQIKNTGKNLDIKKAELQEMMKIVRDAKIKAKTKLYISCVTECPLNGQLDNDYIMHEIISSYGVTDIRDIPEYDEICISDTMGTLSCKNFEYIVDGMIRFGVAPSRISLHLHINSENCEEAKQILFACFRRKINKFDVSVISDGGCSVTMNPDKLKPNMTYGFLHKCIEEYSDSVFL